MNDPILTLCSVCANFQLGFPPKCPILLAMPIDPHPVVVAALDDEGVLLEIVIAHIATELSRGDRGDRGPRWFHNLPATSG